MLTVEDFPAFFSAIHAKPPFPWQIRLVNQVAAERKWPSTIGLPTGSGKTALIDIATFLLALEVDLPHRVTPIRIFFVVDRRLVVDQAADHAEELAHKLETASDGILNEVSKRLRAFGGKPLANAKLRGGMVYERPWCDDPRQPTIVSSTVDQIGSRLLFRGYGCSNSRRPLEAGLLGNESLIIVDEAHLSGPFLETLEAARTFGANLQWVQMSGTARNNHSPFKLGLDDLENEVLGRRLKARKRAQLQKCSDLSVAAVAATLQLAAKATVIGVIVNTVDMARGIFEQLRRAFGPGAVALLIGRVRPYDRDAVLATWLPRIEVGRDRNQAPPTFLVATQTIEVGADIDFDALITEAAPLDVLRQRFGRLDRLGELGETNAIVLQGPDRLSAYGDAIQNAWKWLNERAKKKAGEKVIDFGVLSIDRLTRDETIEELCTPVTHAPIMLPAHLQAWCQTSPVPQADPAVAPFLHGPEAFDADEVEIIWRADLEGDWLEPVALAPPDSREAMPVPLYAARQWLGSRDVLVWRGIDDKRTGKQTANSIRPGDTIVIPANYGGCDEFGWHPTLQIPVTDLGDRSEKWVRLHPGLLGKDIAHRMKKLTNQEELDSADVAAFLSEMGITDAKPESARMYGSGIIVRRRPDNTAEDDASSVMTVPVLLSDHSNGVERHAQLFARGCGFPEQLEEQLVLAARLHDLGKLDSRFQALLHQGDLLEAYRALANGKALAKSGGAWSLADYQRYRASACYPRAARHEAGSVKLAEQLIVGDLVLHLVASHHGHARPWMPLWEEAHGLTIKARFERGEVEASTGSDLGEVDSAVVERFWALSEEYGTWLLAYLEAILRLADHRQSQEESCG